MYGIVPPWAELMGPEAYIGNRACVQMYRKSIICGCDSEALGSAWLSFTKLSSDTICIRLALASIYFIVMVSGFGFRQSEGVAGFAARLLHGSSD